MLRRLFRWTSFRRSMAVCLLVGCASPRRTPPSVAPSSGLGEPLPSLDVMTRAFDVRAGGEVSLTGLIDALASADVVFVGETHLDDTTHRLELAIYEGLAARRGDVVLAMEMFERDGQSVLDDYLGGRLTEADFIERSRPWANYRTDYRPLIEAAKQRGLPVVAANVSVDVRRKVAMGGKDAFLKLSDAEREQVAKDLFPDPDAYWQRVDRAVHGHGGGGQPATADERLYSTQCLWDNTMAESIAFAIDRRPGAQVVHVNGSFHSDYGGGIPTQLAKRKPSARIATVSIVPTDDLETMLRDQEKGRADFVVYALVRARGLSDGLHGVTTSSELRFGIDLPKSAGFDHRAPLLVWLADDGTRTRDAQAYWKAALGDDAAVLVVEPPYRETADDLHVGGRWAYGDTITEDEGGTQEGLERISEYVARHYPVDASRIVLAGEGSGGTAVLWSALYSRRLPLSMVAVDPRSIGKLAEEPLPELPPATRRLTIVPSLATHEQLDDWVAGARGVGLDAATAVLPAGDPARRWAIENAVRSALGLAVRSYEASREAGPRTLLLLDADTTLAREWASIHARDLERQGGVATIAAPEGIEDALRALDEERETSRVVMKQMSFRSDQPEAFRPSDLADGKALPLAPGSFGGTTVLVVPAGASDEARAGWKLLEEKKAIRSRSRFASLRVAFAEGEPSLGKVLDEIRESGRSNVLVVPAAYCATADEMRRMRADAASHARALEIAWLPGLGAEIRPPEKDP
ncbi:MAG: ChaN family lipoprotein [Planctomycetes bacterium]|nr:ChaN family lipoprotein [Planctomycetota bacterium]MBI3845385.1 ChaN family lipoprotein [Planctomycetota bacterium]